MTDYPVQRTYTHSDGTTTTVTLDKADHANYEVTCDERPGWRATGDTPKQALEAWDENHGPKVPNLAMSAPDTHAAEHGGFSTP